MVYLTIDTKPVKGHVTIRDRYYAGPILAEGTAPVETYKSGQWAFFASFGEVEGYIKPIDDGGKVLSDKRLTYTYIPLETPPEEPPNGEPPKGEPSEDPVSRLLIAIVGLIAAIVTGFGIGKLLTRGREEK